MFCNSLNFIVFTDVWSLIRNWPLTAVVQKRKTLVLSGKATGWNELFVIGTSVKVKKNVSFRKDQFSHVFRSSFSGSAQFKTALKQTNKRNILHSGAAAYLCKAASMVKFTCAVKFKCWIWGIDATFTKINHEKKKSFTTENICVYSCFKPVVLNFFG